MNGIFYVFVMYGSVYVRDVSDFKQNNTPMHTNVISFNDPRRIAWFEMSFKIEISEHQTKKVHYVETIVTVAHYSGTSYSTR